MGCCGKKTCALATSILSFIFLVLTIVFIVIGYPTILKNELALNGKGQAWDFFVEVPFPLTLEVYFFNIDNPEGILQNEKPRLTEIGPYSYKEYRQKRDISADGDFVSYRQHQIFHFDREKTPENLNADDEITLLNPIVWGVYQYLEHANVELDLDIQAILGEILDDNRPVFQGKVNEILFDGVKFCKPDHTNVFGKILCLLLMILNVTFVEYNQDLSMSYSFLKWKNDTDDGVYVANRGMEDLQEIGQIQTWNNLTHMKFWKGKDSVCNKVEGRDVAVYPPDIQEGSSFKLFSSDICGSQAINFDKKSQYRDIDTFTFSVGEKFFRPLDNESAEDSCFCIKKTRGMDGAPSCFLDGTLDMQSCFGIPGILSLPHFLFADEKYKNSVEGVEPDITKHNLEMQLQPDLGIPVKGAKKVQMSFVIRPVYFGTQVVEMTKNTARALLPIIWVNEGVEVSGKYYDLVKLASTVLKVVHILKWVLVALFAVLFLVPGGLFFKFRRTEKLHLNKTAPET